MALWTKIRLEPRLVIWSLIVASVPALMATIMITAATPMMMPSMGRKERTLFLRIASVAIRRASDGRMGYLPLLLLVAPAVADHFRHQPILQLDGTLRVLCDGGIMGDHDDGHALLVEPMQDIHDLLAGTAIE